MVQVRKIINNNINYGKFKNQQKQRRKIFFKTGCQCGCGYIYYCICRNLGHELKFKQERNRRLGIFQSILSVCKNSILDFICSKFSYLLGWQQEEYQRSNQPCDICSYLLSFVYLSDGCHIVDVSAGNRHHLFNFLLGSKPVQYNLSHIECRCTDGIVF